MPDTVGMCNALIIRCFSTVAFLHLQRQRRVNIDWNIAITSLNDVADVGAN